MARTRCKKCGKWGTDRCICSSKKSKGVPTSADDKPERKKPVTNKKTTKTTSLENAQKNRRLELEVELAKVQLMQSRMDMQRKKKREEKKEHKKKEAEKDKQNARWYGNTRWYTKWWSRPNNNRWWQNQRRYPTVEAKDAFDAEAEAELSACNDGMN